MEHVRLSIHFKNKSRVNMSMEVDAIIPETIQARFVSDTGEEAGPPLDLPTSVNISQLGRICNAILQNVCISIDKSQNNKFEYLCIFLIVSGGSIKLFIFHR